MEVVFHASIVATKWSEVARLRVDLTSQHLESILFSYQEGLSRFDWWVITKRYIGSTRIFYIDVECGSVFPASYYTNPYFYPFNCKRFLTIVI